MYTKKVKFLFHLSDKTNIKIGGIILLGENGSTRRKTCPAPHYQSTTLDGLSYDRTRFLPMRGRQMTARDTTPLLKSASNLYSTQTAAPTSQKNTIHVTEFFLLLG
jgi:hypothetical protein